MTREKEIRQLKEMKGSLFPEKTSEELKLSFTLYRFEGWIDTTRVVQTEKAMAPHSSTLAWKIPRTEEPGGLQSMGSLRVGHDWATSLSLLTFMHGRRKWQPTPGFLPGESQGRGRGRGAWWAAVYGVAQSQTRLKWLSSSSRVVQKPHKGRNNVKMDSS